MNNPHLPVEDRPDPELDDEPIEESSGAMPFIQHLEDLRKALWKSSMAIAVGMFGGWTLAPLVLEDLIARTYKNVYVISPFEGFNERFKLSMILAIALAAPVVFWQIWSFVVPGLLKKERKLVPGLVLSSMVLFAIGAYAAYIYVVPLIAHVLEGFNPKGVINNIRLSLLLEFAYNLALSCGILMQLPLVTMLLTAIGLVQPMFLLKQWRMALVVIFVVTALITPGDVVSAQIVLGVPMLLLYFISVGLSFFVAKKKSAADREFDQDRDEDEA